MWQVGFGFELGLIAWVWWEYIKNKKREKPVKKNSWAKEGKQRGERKEVWDLFMPAAMRLARLQQRKAERREHNKVYQILCQLTSEEEAEGLFDQYAGKRWAMFLAAAILCVGVFTGQQWLMAGEEETMALTQPRPAYGEGDEKKKVLLTLEQKGKHTEETVSLYIPQREMNQQQLQQKLQAGMAYIEAYLQDKVVYEDIHLPG